MQLYIPLRCVLPTHCKVSTTYSGLFFDKQIGRDTCRALSKVKEGWSMSIILLGPPAFSANQVYHHLLQEVIQTCSGNANPYLPCTPTVPVHTSLNDTYLWNTEDYWGLCQRLVRHSSNVYTFPGFTAHLHFQPLGI